MARISEGARIGGNVIIAGFLGTAVILGGIGFNAVVPQAWASWTANVDRIRAEQARGDEIAKSAMDKEYASMCKGYFKASFIERNWNYWNYRWCDDYKDRMPGGDT